MLYVVSGHMRTGTSMMMKALEAGGLDAAYQQSRDEIKDRYADEHYDPNVGGLYELARPMYHQPKFPRMYDGKLIKGMNLCVTRMLVMPAIRVVFMRRDDEEIRQSYDAFFGADVGITSEFQTRMDEIVKMIRNRKDVKSCHEFWYRDVVRNPLTHFETLRDAGWAIDPQKCAEIVDPKYCRFKRENLSVGVV